MENNTKIYFPLIRPALRTSSMAEASLPQESIFAAALELPVADRAAFLDKACAGNSALRREVANLLRAHDRTGDGLELTQIQARVREPDAPSLPDLPGY